MAHCESGLDWPAWIEAIATSVAMLAAIAAVIIAVRTARSERRWQSGEQARQVMARAGVDVNDEGQLLAEWVITLTNNSPFPLTSVYFMVHRGQEFPDRGRGQTPLFRLPLPRGKSVRVFRTSEKPDAGEIGTLRRYPEEWLRYGIGGLAPNAAVEIEIDDPSSPMWIAVFTDAQGKRWWRASSSVLHSDTPNGFSRTRSRIRTTGVRRYPTSVRDDETPAT
ncbi:hypothetical protein [Cryptosporangium sp. NPDC051539]|uniref:hypothetical protein n=1 Tax=Cryptosporangium sp. NPDC051539 TaxID=3363962 RepID=UPI0037B54A90